MEGLTQKPSLFSFSSALKKLNVEKNLFFAAFCKDSFIEKNKCQILANDENKHKIVLKCNNRLLLQRFNKDWGHLGRSYFC